MPLGSSIPFAAFTVAIWTVGEMLSLPLLNAMAAGRATATNRGRYMGIYLLAYSVAFIIAPASGSWVFEEFGPTTLWFGVGAMAPVLGGTALAIRRFFPEPRPEAE